jgi:hypothetical protein
MSPGHPPLMSVRAADYPTVSLALRLAAFRIKVKPALFNGDRHLWLRSA